MSDLTWFSDRDDVAHAFANGAWMRSLCGECRWTAALGPTARSLCPACLSLANEVRVERVGPQPTPADREARRVAIARARARRRWRRTET